MSNNSNQLNDKIKSDTEYLDELLSFIIDIDKREFILQNEDRDSISNIIERYQEICKKSEKIRLERIIRNKLIINCEHCDFKSKTTQSSKECVGCGYLEIQYPHFKNIKK